MATYEDVALAVEALEQYGKQVAAGVNAADSALNTLHHVIDDHLYDPLEELMSDVDMLLSSVQDLLQAFDDYSPEDEE